MRRCDLYSVEWQKNSLAPGQSWSTDTGLRLVHREMQLKTANRKCSSGYRETVTAVQGPAAMTDKLETYHGAGKAGKLATGMLVRLTGNLPTEVPLKIKGTLSTGVPPKLDGDGHQWMSPNVPSVAE